MLKRNRSSHPQTQDPSTAMQILRASLWGLSAFLISAVVLLLLSSLLCVRLPDPDAMLLPCALVSLYLPSLLGGLVTVRKCGGAALPAGLCTGLLLMLLTLFAAWLLPSGNGGLSLPLSFGLRFLIPVFSIFGSIIGVNLKKSKRRRKAR